MKLSFEFFPPYTQERINDLKEVRKKLKVLNPEYYSVTFGAGGSSKKYTYETVLDIQTNDNVIAVPHLTCIAANHKDIDKFIYKYKKIGVNSIIALRGDAPPGMQNIGDFRFANEIVSYIREKTGDYFDIKVAAYPEYHPQAKSCDADINYFINKVKAGANSAITQYFYNVDAFFNFKNEVIKKGLDVEIVPGIMPITNPSLIRFSNLCSAEIPRWILNKIYDYKDDLKSITKFGEEVVTNLCVKLKQGGVDNFHFYTMNKAEPTLSIAKNL